jgi:uncharacterized LabA/DUF88 family protein
VPSAVRRVAAFIDGSNIYYTMRDTLGWTIDWKRFRAFLDRFGEVGDCLYYVGRSDDPAGGQQAFISMLAHSGYSLELKELKTIAAGDGSLFRKANMDVEIAVDMLARLDTYDTAVLASGDGDMERPLRFLRDRGKDVFVVSTERRLALELLWLAGPNFIELEDIRAEIERPRGSQEY